MKLIYFDFNFWRVDILRLCLSYSNISYKYERVPRQDWQKKKQSFPFGQLPVLIYDNNIYAHTHSLAIFCAQQANLYDNDKQKILIINQVLDWANDITIKIAPSIRAAMREKNYEKSKRLRKEFIKNDLLVWFSYLEQLLKRSSSENKFFTDKFSIADIIAWRVIYWFTSRKLDHIDPNFLKELPKLKNYYQNLMSFESLNNLREFKEITKAD